jgi:hypothetical protein
MFVNKILMNKLKSIIRDWVSIYLLTILLGSKFKTVLIVV